MFLIDVSKLVLLVVCPDLWQQTERSVRTGFLHILEQSVGDFSSASFQDLKKAHTDRPLSLLPQIWTKYKKDELANIYKKHGTQKEKESIYELLFYINPSQNSYWDKIKE